MADFQGKTAAFPNDIRKQKHICFSFPVQRRDLWTCGSCKSFAASRFYLQYLLANLLWWKNVGGSSIHLYFLLSPLLDHALSVLADHRSPQLLAWGTSTKWKKIDWRFGTPENREPLDARMLNYHSRTHRLNKVKYNTHRNLTLLEHTHHIYILINQVQRLSSTLEANINQSFREDTAITARAPQGKPSLMHHTGRIAAWKGARVNLL